MARREQRMFELTRTVEQHLGRHGHVGADERRSRHEAPRALDLDDARVQKELPYAENGLTADLYSPASGDGEARPAVIFISVTRDRRVLDSVGLRRKGWRIVTPTDVLAELRRFEQEAR